MQDTAERRNHVIDVADFFEKMVQKNCSAVEKLCKNCGKANHFAKICRSQQVSEEAEKTSEN